MTTDNGTPVHATWPAPFSVRYEDQDRITFKVDEAARLIGISVDRVRELCRNGLIKTVKIRPGSAQSTYLIPAGQLYLWANTFDDPAPSTQ